MRFAAALLGASAALLIGAAPAPLANIAEQQAANRIRGDVEFLASDLLEGRDTGSRGHAIAASYVASQFEALGLRPGGISGGWYQQVPFRRASHAQTPNVSFVFNGKATPLISGRDVALRPSLTEQDRAIDSGLVFAGHGISEPRLGIDEYAGLDVRGKIVVALSGSPNSLPAEIAAHLESSKDETARRKGAIGLIEVSVGGAGRFRSVEAAAARPLLDWVDAAGKPGSSGDLRVQLSLSPEWAARLFNRSPRPFAAVQSAALSGKPIAGFALPGRLRIRARSAWQDFTSPEVIGLLPGRDLRLGDEYVVLMGHLDHLGIKADAKPGEDAIYNGALDNGAGVATMLEAAREFVSSGKPPLRSVLFIANTGEEKGLLGADYYAAHPTVPLKQIVSVVDLDMPLLLYPFTDVIAFGADHSTVARTVAEAGRSMGIAVSPDPMPEESIFVRSDHYRFVTRGVPAILLMTGWANGGQAIWKPWLATIYHSPKDDLSQNIDWLAGARYAELNYRISRALADDPQRPLWYKGDYFGDTFAPGQPRAVRRP